MKKTLIDSGWQFWFGKQWWSKADKKLINLPHDFSMELGRDKNSPGGSSNGFFKGGVGVYERKIDISACKQGQKVMVEFEGVYMNASVYINDQLAAKHPYGYTSFHVDLTPYIKYDGENILKVEVNNSAMPNTRWYSGSGIYRHVWLMTGSQLHIAPWGISTKSVDVTADKAVVIVETNIVNTGDIKKARLSTALYDDNCEIAAYAVNDIEVPVGGIKIVDEITVKNPHLWSADDPFMYKVGTKLESDDSIDEAGCIDIGIRNIVYNAKQGLLINGESVLLKGGCVHHDCGLLGSAAYDRAEERKVELLKQSGFNAVRCAHNPPSPAFLDACDRLGMYVIDETFDCWRQGKNPYDYGQFFEDWWERDTTSMVMRDRNHPSIIIWSIGNEIAERDGRSDGYKWAKRQVELVKSLDDTRAVLSALNNVASGPMMDNLSANMLENDANDYFGSATKPFFDELDIAGYNYLIERYEDDVIKYPDRVICATETFPINAYDYWMAVEKYPSIIGDFVWTSIDYLGEAGIGQVWYGDKNGFLGDYPWCHANCGDIDINGFKRPQSYFRDCLWGIAEKPYIAVHPPKYNGMEGTISRWGWPIVEQSWTFPEYEGESVDIEVYSMDEKVELFVNGTSMGRMPAGKENRYTASFKAQYSKGEITAIGYNDGIETSKTIVKTADVPAEIVLKPDKCEISAAAGDLSFITVELLDADGNLCHNADNKLCFSVSGEGSLKALGNSDPASEESFTGNVRSADKGRIMAVVCSNGCAGDIILTAIADGLKGCEIVIKAVELK